MPRSICCVLALCLAACDDSAEEGPLDIALIGDEESLFAQRRDLPPGARHLRAATSVGLVAVDQSGQVVPAIAERWIVTDDAMSYIFRLRDTEWPNGEKITAEEIERALSLAIDELQGSALGLDLAKVTEIRAMTGRVVEIRLSGPMPEFLRLLAQPELGLRRAEVGAGPMIVTRDEDASIARLELLPPPEGGEPLRAYEQENARALAVRAMPARDAIDAFARGQVDVLIGGTVANFPMVQLGPLSRGAIRVDPTIGLFGLSITQESGLLSNPERREALSMAIDRPELMQSFGLGGWQPTTWIVPQSLFNPLQYPASRWGALSIEQRRAIGLARIAAWERSSGVAARVTVGLPPGPGSDLLFQQLAEAWRTIGVEAVRVDSEDDAELELLDVVASYSSPRWFLNRFACSLARAFCSPEADALVRESLVQRNPLDKQSLLADAHLELVDDEVFIPLGAPVRWSLVRGAVSGYEANPWGLHPLFPLSQRTN